MEYNYDANCNNCINYTKKGQCKKAFNMVIDYSRNNNPHCWHWERKPIPIFNKILDYLKK